MGSDMDSTQRRRVIAAGLIGNVLEWYDFAARPIGGLIIGHIGDRSAGVRR
ncbi:hypothetical protein [Bradyrhizobium sp. LHD-71]|uniref:hypothetical protein n=1 Tax=Bradyrhizobium sp. LHD-71 TaxID=3072141 RepID=UPI0028104FEC|nr:hypothetical protein [Bradyrhizobium sp. LHD-71]MDQ8728878.1 hypothetical protein [Bradyrhizobium sp. LHD-71]